MNFHDASVIFLTGLLLGIGFTLLGLWLNDKPDDSDYKDFDDRR